MFKRKFLEKAEWDAFSGVGMEHEIIKPKGVHVDAPQSIVHVGVFCFVSRLSLERNRGGFHFAEIPQCFQYGGNRGGFHFADFIVFSCLGRNLGGFPVCVNSPVHFLFGRTPWRFSFFGDFPVYS